MDSLMVDWSTGTEIANNIFQILFFVAVGVISILSYLQARKTLFTPIKTETFKLQLENLQDILMFFQQKSKIDFNRMFDLDHMLRLNCFMMFDKYVDKFFPDKFDINEEKREKRYEDIVGGIISKEFAEKNIEKVTYETTLGDKDKKIEGEETPAIIASNWQNYEHGLVSVTSQFEKSMDDLRHLAASPIIPSELRNLILEFQRKVHENVEIIGKIITEVARELPEKYPTTESAIKFNASWVANIYNQRSNNLKEPADKILDFINEYLSIEDLKDMS